MASQLAAPAPRDVGPPPPDLPAEDVTLASESGSQLAGWWVPGTPGQGTVVLLHAIRGSRLQMLDRARLLHDQGYSVLLIDFQAHGESPGEHITAGYLERFDAAAAVAYAHERSPEDRIAVIGCSLGGAATLLAAPLPIDAAVLEAVYPTIEEAIDNRTRMRLGPVAPLATQLLLVQLRPRLGFWPSELRPIEHIAQLDCPVLILGGEDDEHTPPAETRRLFAAAVGPKELDLFSGAPHRDLYRFDREHYEQRVLPFLEENLRPQ